MKTVSKKSLVLFTALSAFFMSHIAVADDTPPPADFTTSCLQEYKDKVTGINKFNKWEYGFSYGPAGVGLTFIIIGAQGGSEPLVLGGAAVAGFGGLAWSAIKLPKYIRAKGYVEVVNNMDEALNPKGPDKALRHTTDLISKKVETVNEEEVRAAILAAAHDGAFCGQGGKLVTKGDFRKVVIQYLNGRPSQAAAIASQTQVNTGAAVAEEAKQPNAGATQSKVVSEGSVSTESGTKPVTSSGSGS